MDRTGQPHSGCLPGCGRTTAAAARRLERRRDLEQPPVLAVRRDELQPDRQPSGVVPAGTEIAGQPVTVMKYADRIQSR